jgi:mono/diheme cytochrome c family protein
MGNRVKRPSIKGYRRTLVGFAGVLLALVMLTGCYEMAEQPNPRRQEPPRSAFPAASVPTTGMAVMYTEQQATALQNPLAGNQEATQAGAAVYSLNCRFCHGDDGKGTGAIAQFFPPQPADLTGDRVRGASDGQIFWAITNGFGRMPAFQKVLSVDERWQTVNYVRSLQQR